MTVRVYITEGMAEDYAVVNTRDPSKTLSGVLVAFPREDREWVLLLNQIGQVELSQKLAEYWRGVDDYGNTVR